MFMTNRWKRSEKRALAAGLAMFGASLAGVLTTDGRADRAAAKAEKKAERRGEIRQVAGDTADLDARMESAMDEASTHLEEFDAVLRKPAASQKDFAVKFFAEQGEDAEYLWANEIRFDGKQYAGKVANEPGYVKNLKMGQAITLKPEDVQDWMYVDNGKLKGGYTIRAQRELLKGDDRKKFDEQFKFQFE